MVTRGCYLGLRQHLQFIQELDFARSSGDPRKTEHSQSEFTRSQFHQPNVKKLVAHPAISLLPSLLWYLRRSHAMWTTVQCPSSYLCMDSVLCQFSGTSFLLYFASGLFRPGSSIDLSPAFLWLQMPNFNISSRFNLPKWSQSEPPFTGQ